MSIEFFDDIVIGGVDSVVFILETLISSENGIPRKDLKKYVIDQSLNMAYGFSGILNFLVFIEWVTVDGIGIVSIARNRLSDNGSRKSKDLLREELIHDVLEKLIQTNYLAQLIDPRSFSYDHFSSRICVSMSSIPLTMSGLRNLLLELGFFELHGGPPYVLEISKKYQSFFEKEILPPLHDEIQDAFSSNLTYEKFLEIQKLKDRFGHEAEQFAFQFELHRLEGHPRIYEVKIISRIDISAGYDIVSFESSESQGIDRFIEVKSYIGQPYFFITENELSVARRKRISYFLYLIDRNQIGEIGYTPIIINDPLNTVMKSDKWIVAPRVWRVSATDYSGGFK